MADVIKVAGLTREQVRRLDRLAKRADRTRSAYVRGLVMGAIETEGMGNDRVVGQPRSTASKPPSGGVPGITQPAAVVASLTPESDHTPVRKAPLTRSFDPDAP